MISEITDMCLKIAGTICCDRSNYRSDICFMKGDVRTDSASFSVFLYRPNVSQSFINFNSSILGETEDDDDDEEDEFQHEIVKPYTRKWETSVMGTIDELHLVSKRGELVQSHQCDVQHDVPAVFFSTGGYTGNLYHEFNDGILPLYITSQHFRKKVVFVALEYHTWWIMKYGDVVSRLSDYPVIDFAGDNRTHCFPAAIVGLRIHDELTIDPSKMEGHKTIRDFHDLLDQAYWPRIRGLIQDEEREEAERLLALSPLAEPRKEKQELQLERPNLVIISRNGSRAILNEDSLVELAEDIGFSVRIIRPERTTELAKIYRSLNSSDVMIGVHGAAMTHFLFMRPGSVFIQVIPLGTSWAAETYYSEPAKKLGLKYIDYEILPRESSLYEEYDESDPVLADPESVTNKGWEYTKKIYLDKQNVRLDLRRFRKKLLCAYEYSVAAKSRPLDIKYE